MLPTKADIITRLQKEILPLQGFKPVTNRARIDFGLGPLKTAFPNGVLPLGAVHEFYCTANEDTAATCGFIAGIVSTLMKNGGVCIWISSYRNLFPPALHSFRIHPEKIIFVDLKREKEVLWVMEEALKCDGLAAVVGEIKDLSFIASRRLQLAVEQSRVTGFIIRRNPRNLSTTSCISRWKITHLPSALPDGMPGVGFPKWNVNLLKIRNGTPGSWNIEWAAGKFQHASTLTSIAGELRRKTG